MMGYQDLSIKEINSLLQREKIKLQIKELAWRACPTEDMHDQLVQHENQIWEYEYSLEQAEFDNLDKVRVWILR